MTDPLPIILTLVVALPFILALLAMFLLPLFKRREKGPWVVCRVAADGSGGMEFLSKFGGIWTKNPEHACHFTVIKDAEFYAKHDTIADVALLSKFTGPTHD